MKNLKINTGNDDNPIFKINTGYNIFNQLAVKIDMEGISDEEYFKWLDEIIKTTPAIIPGTSFLEKEGVRTKPPLNTAVYYDTVDYKLLHTGALLRTSCSILTHAFCAFKMPEDEYGNRLDRRHVFEGDDKKTIQLAPYSKEAINIVKSLLSREDIEHPGKFLKEKFNISSDELSPAVVLLGNRSTFYVCVDGYDTLRCSIDRSVVFNYRTDYEGKNKQLFRECEISIYPRISETISKDKRVIDLIYYLVNSLTDTFQKEIIYDIKYQRGAKVLNFF
ncbi:MAG: hypothetical protein LN563_00635 [Rickettsia endosymbiont of Platyusa sonomae]|nr:hypothetical protein [Rickettsia endosymbiont of Platyusa sonomae]